MRKPAVLMFVSVFCLLTASAAIVVHDYDASEYYLDNYREYSYNYHPRDRPYAIAGTQIARIYVRDSEGNAIAIPEFFPSSRYEDALAEGPYEDDYIDAPFEVSRRSSLQVRYSGSVPPSRIQGSTITVRIAG
jgi:hypothetical protein